MEPYQSGMLISDDGTILTVFSYVLDTEDITATLADGRKFPAKLLGADPRLEIALLKIEAVGLPHFDLGEAVDVEAGTRVLALSNLFGVATGDEPASVQHGVISVRAPLQARRGAFDTVYRGTVYVLDAVTNNPGAAGGALVTRRGALVGLLGKELRNAQNNTWLNYALPIDELRASVDAIREGKFTVREAPPEQRPDRPLQLELLGIVLLPDVLERTPPYVDLVRPGSPAARAGMLPDDLILLLDDRLIQSCKSLREEFETIDFEDQIKLTVLRGQDLVELAMQYLADEESPSP
jgi:serine protease Do